MTSQTIAPKPPLNTDEVAAALDMTPGKVRKLVRSNVLLVKDRKAAYWEYPAAQVEDLKGRLDAHPSTLAGIAPDAGLLQVALGLAVVPPAFVALLNREFAEAGWRLLIYGVSALAFLTAWAASLSLYTEYLDDVYGCSNIPDVDTLGVARMKSILDSPPKIAHWMLLAALTLMGPLFLVCLMALAFASTPSLWNFIQEML